MFKRTKLSAGLALAFGGVMLAGAVQAQDAQRIEITGSAIRRVDAETAVPVTVIKMDDLKKSGVTSVEQVMASLSAVQLSGNTTVNSVGSGGGGASFADIRGIGADKTLVLLNGHRLANNAVDGSAPDLNMIPLAAIDRIEVLRDGASSLYGTDAIGGVINFITKKDYQGGTISLGYDSPQHPGGKTTSASAGFGYGDLENQGYNLFGFVSYRKQDSIAGDQRDFNKRIAGGLSYSTAPANYTQDQETFYNQELPACSGTAMQNIKGVCKLVTPNFVDFVPKTETFSAMLKGGFKVNSDLTLGAELFGTQNKVTTMVAPVPYGGYYVNPGTTYYPTNPALDPTFDDGSAGAPAFAATNAFKNPVNVQPGFIYVFWRDFPNGSRGQMNKNNQNRLLLTADGSVAGWDYSVSAAYNRNKVDQYLTSGYADGDMIGEGLLEGVINPFGDQTAAGTQLLQEAALTGRLQYAVGTVKAVDAHGSRDLGDWFGAGRPAQIALGFEHRNESYLNAAEKDFAAKVAVSTGIDPDMYNTGSRTVNAVYAELNVPLLKVLDVTASVRHDRYNDFGSTTNPKVSFRFQPTKDMLFRGSASTGFRAPTLYELYSGNTYTNTSGDYNNPVLCKNGTGTQCDVQFQALNGGNTNLKPETSKSLTLGTVYQVTSELNVGIDLWWIRTYHIIGAIAQNALFNDYYDYPSLQQYFHYAPGNKLSITSNCPGALCGYVDQRYQNLGNLNTNGVDLSAQYRLKTSWGQFDIGLSSTYVNVYDYQDFVNGYWVHNAGAYAESGPVFRWQHNVAANWHKDTFGAGVALHNKSGYDDYNPSTHPEVASYTTADIYGSWEPVKGASLVLGIRNVFDRAPPFTNQADNFQAGGYDPRYADPTGRTYYLRVNYSF